VYIYIFLLYIYTHVYIHIYVKSLNVAIPASIPKRSKDLFSCKYPSKSIGKAVVSPLRVAFLEEYGFEFRQYTSCGIPRVQRVTWDKFHFLDIINIKL
jgi:hypothetical protein